MFTGLSPIGLAHTAISLVALATACASLHRHQRIVPDSPLGRTYVQTTVLTCLSGFFIVDHEGFGQPHVLGVLTLALLGLAHLAGQGRFGGAAPYVALVAYAITLLFHAIAAVAETATRLPVGAPLLPGPEAPELRLIAGGLGLLCLLGVGWQIHQLRRARRRTP